MQVFITGGTGFVGSHVAACLLHDGHSVRALARAGSDVAFLEDLGATIVRGDVTAPGTLHHATNGCDLVVHCAAIVGGFGRWEQYYQVGVLGTRNVLAAAVAGGVPRFVHLSSIAVYGTRINGRTVSESDPYEPRPESWNHYVREKVQSERLAFSYHERGLIEVTAVRPSVIWGSRDRTAFPAAIAILKNPVAAVVGPGNNRIASVSVTDVADVCRRAGTTPVAAGRAYNVSSDQHFTQRQLYALLAGATGLRPPRRHVPAAVPFGAASILETAYTLLRVKSAPPFSRLNTLIIAGDVAVDCRLARAELGWTQLQGVPEAIAEAAAWHQARGA